MSPNKSPQLHGKFQNLTNHIRASYLFIIIWGPSRGQPSYKKRTEIKSGLSGAYPNADIFFPEDKELNDMLHDNIPESKGWKAKQKGDSFLEICDLCIALDIGKGVGEEIARAIDTQHNSKLYIFTDSRYRNRRSYPADIRTFGNQKFYTRAQFKDCELVDWAIQRADLLSFTIGLWPSIK